MAAFTPELFGFALKQMICSESICLFPVVRFVFTMDYCKGTRPRCASFTPVCHCLTPVSCALHCGTALL